MVFFNPYSSDPYLLRLREGFRAFSLKVAAADMKALSENSSFQIHISTTEQGSHTLACDPDFEVKNGLWSHLAANEFCPLTKISYLIHRIFHGLNWKTERRIYHLHVFLLLGLLSLTFLNCKCIEKWHPDGNSFDI